MKNVLYFFVLFSVIIIFNLSVKPRLANSVTREPVEQADSPDPANPEKPIVQRIIACKTWPSGTLTMRVVSSDKIMFEVQVGNESTANMPSEEAEKIAIEYAKEKLGDPLPKSKLIFNKSADGLTVDIIKLEKPPIYD